MKPYLDQDTSKYESICFLDKNNKEIYENNLLEYKEVIKKLLKYTHRASVCERCRVNYQEHGIIFRKAVRDEYI